MPTWLHRTTKDLLTSVAAADLPESAANYILEPDLSAVAGQPARYWTITGDVVTLQSAGEQAATDAAIDAQQRVDQRPIVVASASAPGGLDIRALIETFNKRDNYLVNRIEELQQDLQAIKASSGPADNIRAAIRSSYLATSTRPRSEAVQAYTDDITAGTVDT